MNRRAGLRAGLGVGALACGFQVRAQTAAPAPAEPVGAMKALGQDRFQVGRIVVDRRANRFMVPGRVLVVGKPLEYLASSPRGMKAYEAMLELDATGSEFNLACILIGLERDAEHVPARQYRMVPRLVGPRVQLSLAWSDVGTTRQVPAAQALLNPEAGIQAEAVEWVYVGSPATRAEGGFAADKTGTLIGFVHDSNSIIESAAPVGLGAYGSVRGHSMLPPMGTPIELIVEAGKA